MSCSRLESRRGALARLAVAVVVCLLAGRSVDAERQSPDNDAPLTLRWQNGDELPGTLVGATNNRIKWQSPILSRPVTLDLNHLESIRATGPTTGNGPSGPFRFALAGGDLVFGELVGISDEHMRVRSPRHGELSIRRSSVASIVRTDRADVVDLTRSDGRSWQSTGPWNSQGRNQAGWNDSEPGQVSSTAPGARLYLPVDLPDVCDIELHLEWQGKTPTFTFAYGTLDQFQRRQAAVQLDTWADELVVQTSARPDDFEPVMTLTPDRKSLRLRIIWDRAAGKLAVFGEDGQLLAETAGKRDGAAGGGLLLENKGADLTVKRLRVGKWDAGQRPQPAIGQDRIRTFAGVEVYGDVSGLDEDGAVLVESSDGQTARVPLADVAEMAVRRGAAAAAPVGNCELKYSDGARLRGLLVSVEDGIASLRTAFSDDEVNATLAGLLEFKLPAAAGNRQAVGPGNRKPNSPYVLELGEHRLHGTLAPAGTAVGWRPVGSDDVIPIATTGTARITRLEQAKAVPNGQSKFVDVIHLRSGDRAPCTIKAIDDVGVHLAASVGEAIIIPREEVRAIEFKSASLAPLYGFLDRRWQIVQRQANAVERTDDRLILRGRADFSHPELLKGGGFEFDLEWHKDIQASLNIYLFTLNNARQANSPRLQMSLVGNQLQVAVIVGNQGRSHVLRLEREANEPKRFSFYTEGAEMKVLVDGALVCSIPLPSPKPAGTGVNISCTFPSSALKKMQAANAIRQAANNQGGRANAAGNPNDDFLLAISNLRAGRAAGVFRNLVHEDDQTKHFLIIPRSRRHNPFKHALVAQNGDLLRGELLTLGPSIVRFRSGFDDVAVPRDRLAGIVWLSADGEAPPQPVRDGLMQATFLNGSVLSLAFEHVADNEVIGRHPVLGLCRVTLDDIDELRIGEPHEDDPRLAYSGWTLISAQEPIIPGAAAPDGEFGTFSPLLGQQAEDFTLEMLDGKRFRLSEHRDKIVVLDFWATWCGPCVQAFPQLIAATADFKPEDVLFVAVNQQENSPVIQGFMESHGWDFQVALDREGEVGRKYQVDSIPQTVVIGRDGTIERVNLGVHPNVETGLKTALQELIDGTNSPPDSDGE